MCPRAVDGAPRPAIDELAVHRAVLGIGDRERVAAAAARFALLGDPGRLSLLLAMHRAGPIPVSDLARAAGMSATAVSQALRLLRDSGVVAAAREGRLVRYRLCDDAVGRMLDLLDVAPEAAPPDAVPVPVAVCQEAGTGRCPGPS
ncbi:ArsR/SmtB family transcription factor [Kitasatospora sp. NPDC059722]|uniref:ArsR/SmtB family transcription factor n=1 Tax=unclassified Kitasatospora TaxID=2633591 RepID=UPI0036B4A688